MARQRPVSVSAPTGVRPRAPVDLAPSPYVQIGWGLLVLVCGTALHALSLQTILGQYALASNLFAPGLWADIVTRLGAKVVQSPGMQPEANVSWSLLWGLELGVSLVAWLVGGAWLNRCCGRRWGDALQLWGIRGWLWFLAIGSWDLWRLCAFVVGWSGLEMLLSATPELWQALLIAGWCTTFFSLAARPHIASTWALGQRIAWPVWLAIACYVICFGTMNTLLYQGLLVPHGDSAMYEEHLWNLLHGKGFRSYLDQGLFLGEHIQVIHLALIPAYLLWPSHLLLEWCESLALGLGAIPVYLMAERHSQSRMAATLLAMAYLLYFPMQRLDISIDFKTFRPEAFGVPLLLASLWELDRRRWKAAAVWLVLTLLVKEDYGLVFAPLGIWVAVRSCLANRQKSSDSLLNLEPDEIRVNKNGIWFGLGLAIFSVAYLVLAVKVIIPWFRSGNTVHYARYFSKFGDTTNAIIWNLLTQPGLLMGELFTAENALFALALLAPIGFLSLKSPGRLAVGLPLFGALCLNEIARNPQHHFHAPLVAILFWAAAAALKNSVTPAPASTGISPTNVSSAQRPLGRFLIGFPVACAAATGLFYSQSPLGITFWDAHTSGNRSSGYWRDKYIPGERAKLFPQVIAEIPRDSRVASTDFVHPRFTHYARSYDFSDFRPTPPADTDYLVIDVHGPYSEVQTPADVKPYHDHPDQWELLPDKTQGWFWVFKRKSPGAR